MEKEKNGKVAALITTVIVLVLALRQRHDWADVGISLEARSTTRMLYHFYHASVLHAALNCWSLLSVVFLYEISLSRMLTAYAVAASVPAVCLSHHPTVGLSGVIFVLLGTISFEVKRKRYYQSWMIAFIAIGFLFPNTNAWVHLYCYLAGVIAALLNKPIKVK